MSESVCESVSESVSQSFPPSDICLSTSLCLSHTLRSCLSVFISVCQSVCLSLSRDTIIGVTHIVGCAIVSVHLVSMFSFCFAPWKRSRSPYSIIVGIPIESLPVCHLSVCLGNASVTVKLAVRVSFRDENMACTM